MKRIQTNKALLLIAAAPILLVVDLAPEAPLGIALGREAAAIAQQQAPSAGSPPVGAVVPSLPVGSVAAPKGGVEYFRCGNAYYRAAFQGNNLVYVAVAQP